MANRITLTAKDGTQVEFLDEIIGQGAVKDVYFSPEKSYVVCFYRKKQDAASIERLQNIVGVYKERIFNQEGGAFWKDVLCWPDRLLEWNGLIGLTCPTYRSHFFFTGGPFDRKEKEGKWFASAKLRNRFLPADQKGTWLFHLHICLNIARAVRRLHAAGLAHSDLSYKNVLVDPVSGRACVIDCDGLVVPGKFPPDVVGTPDFIAPEVVKTQSLKLGDPKKQIPNIKTDCQALAVLIYMYLLYRHPLRGGQICDLDPIRDEELSMGGNALFIEHPTNKNNRVKAEALDDAELPQGDPIQRPYSLCGPYLQKLFDRAFIEGLHNAMVRPSAAEWEEALLKTADLVLPCQNPNCEAHWFVYDNKTRAACPYCGQPYHAQLPLLNLYYSPRHGRFISENHRVMVYDKQTLYMWHVNRFIVPNERTTLEEKKPVGDFHFHKGQWLLVNRRLPSMFKIDENGQKIQIPIGSSVTLTEGQQILLSTESGGRLALVQLVNG